MLLLPASPAASFLGGLLGGNFGAPIMEVNFNTDLQTKVNRVAAENQSDAAEFVQHLVEHYIDDNGWFRQKVKAGLA